jgi:hypothetical protein
VLSRSHKGDQAKEERIQELDRKESGFEEESVEGDDGEEGSMDEELAGFMTPQNSFFAASYQVDLQHLEKFPSWWSWMILLITIAIALQNTS